MAPLYGLDRLRRFAAPAFVAAAAAAFVSSCQGSSSGPVVLGSAAPACRPRTDGGKKPAPQLVPPAQKPAGLRLLDGAVSYQTDIKPMMDQYCAQCHSGNASPDLSTYAAVSQFASDCLSDMQQGTMPKGQQMPEDQVTKFQAWITAGTPENGAGPVTPPVNPNPVSPPVNPNPVSPPVTPNPVTPSITPPVAPTPGVMPPVLPNTNPVYPPSSPTPSVYPPGTPAPSTGPVSGPDCM